MKRLFITLVATLLVAAALPAQENLFDKYADREGVITVFISKRMFDMMKGITAQIDAVQFINSLKPKLKSECRDNIFVVPGNHDATSAFIESELGKPDSKEYEEFKEHLISGNLNEEDRNLNDSRFSYY